MATSTSSTTAQFGIIGLDVMSENLALNVEDHGHSVAVWNMESDWVDRFVQQNPSRQIIGTKSVQELCRSLERPRRIILMITAGDPVDQTLQKLLPYLAPGDILIDAGNSHFKDTMRRELNCRDRMVKFFGMGISGGAEGARVGPSLMVGGDCQTYETLAPVLQSIAAKSDSGPCVTYVGPDGAGHFAKIVHNGIEYADMQLIAEAYEILGRGLGLSAGEMADVFDEWNRGALESYLIEITAKILRVADPETGKPLINVVLDKAGQRSGKWSAQVALDLGVPVPTIAAALDARFLSTMKEERVIASRLLTSPASTGSAASDKRQLVQALHDALYAAKICSYAQGMSLIRAGSEEWCWNIHLRELARIWKGGCIIRARMLNAIMQAFERQPGIPNLMLDSEFAAWLRRSETGFRQIVSTAVQMGIPVPAFSASLSYYDGYRSEQLPHNLTQAQRDFFGAHTYQRIDRPDAVHTDWAGLLPKPARTSGAKS